MVKKTAPRWKQDDTDHFAKCLEYFDLQLTSGQISNQEDDPIFQSACQQVTRALSERLVPNIEIDTEDAKRVNRLLQKSKLPKKILVRVQLQFIESVNIVCVKEEHRGGHHLDQTFFDNP